MSGPPMHHRAVRASKSLLRGVAAAGVTSTDGSPVTELDDVLDVRDGFSHQRLPPVKPRWEPVLRAISGLPVPFMARKCRRVLARAARGEEGRRLF